MERIEALPLPGPDATVEDLHQYALDVANWAKRLEDRLLNYTAGASYITAALTPTVSVAANSKDTEAFTVSGVTSGQSVSLISQPSSGTAFAIGASVTADNEITITFVKHGTGASTPPTGDYTFMLVTDEA